MADIFDEIDEDLKRDQMQVLWARYGKIVIVTVVVISTTQCARWDNVVILVQRPFFK